MLKLCPTVQLIIVVTDGGSNFGGDPVQAALEANSLGYPVSALGIVDADDPADEVFDEIKKIGAAGGGVSEMATIHHLNDALLRVVRMTTAKQLNGIISGQLKSILATQEDSILPDRTAAKLAEMAERLADEVYLRCVIAVDCSRSMEAKLRRVKDGVISLLAAWQNRTGKSDLALLCYPGHNGELTRLLADFSRDPAYLGKKLKDINSGGGTPTAPAIRAAARLLRDSRQSADNALTSEIGAICL